VHVLKMAKPMNRDVLLFPSAFVASQKAHNMSKRQILDETTRSEIIEMALSDHTSFDAIQLLHGLSADDVKALMRASLKPGSYRAWRKRVRDFGDRRATYK
jgi:uncharacterized protein (TIGR03643 family)